MLYSGIFHFSLIVYARIIELLQFIIDSLYSYQGNYALVIGYIIYLTNCIRPDIARAVNKLSHYTSNPSKEHWKALVCVLRYLKYSQNYELHLSRYPWYLKGTVMQIGYPTTNTHFLLVDMFLQSKVVLSCGNPQNTHV